MIALTWGGGVLGAPVIPAREIRNVPATTGGTTARKAMPSCYCTSSIERKPPLVISAIAIVPAPAASAASIDKT